MHQPPEERPCGETPHGVHPAHRYMLDRAVYQCPGGGTRQPDPVAGAPCPLRALRKPHDAHNWLLADSLPAAPCPGYAEPDDGPGPEPSPPQTDADRIRDLEYVIQRAREALSVETPAVPCGHAERITALEGALRDVLGQFVHSGHPGEPCKQTGWVRVATIDRWHTVLRGEA